MVMDIHCPEILWNPGKVASLAPYVGWRKGTVETSQSLRWSCTPGVEIIRGI